MINRQDDDCHPFRRSPPLSHSLHSLCRVEKSPAPSGDHEKTDSAHSTQGSATIGVVQVETLEQIAERLGWNPERLAEAYSREATKSPPNVSDADHARAEALSESLHETRHALDEAS